MKIVILIVLPLTVLLADLSAEVPINFSTKNLGKKEFTQTQISLAFESYGAKVGRILDGIGAARHDAPIEQKTILDAAFVTLEEIVKRQDVTGMGELLQLLDLLHANDKDESPQIIRGISNSEAKISLNYFVDCVFSGQMIGSADAVSEQQMTAMIRFYAGNPAQTSEGSQETANTMLFVFGDRVIDNLVRKAPDRIGAFYKAVQDARKTAESTEGTDEEAVPSNAPSAEQLRVYEASFSKLEVLVVKGVLSKLDLPASTQTPATLSMKTSADDEIYLAHSQTVPSPGLVLENDELLQFDVDVTGDGKSERLFSRASLRNGKMGHIWSIYNVEQSGQLRLIGEQTFRHDAMAPSVWKNDKTSFGFYSYFPGGGGKGLLLFYKVSENQINRLEEREIEPNGADKEEYDSLFARRLIDKPQEIDLKQRPLPKQ